MAVSTSVSIGPESTTARRNRSFMKLMRHPSGAFGVVILFIVVAAVVAAPLLTHQSPTTQNLSKAFLPPGVDGHVLGTDSLGRDMLSRLLYGGRYSLLISCIATVVGMGIGIPIGIISGYYGGRVDNVIMRIFDVLLAFPYLLLSIVIIGALGPGLLNVTISISVSSIPFYARLLRGMTLSVRNEQYIEAAQTMGCSDWQVMTQCIFRSLLPYIVLNAALNSAYVLLSVAGLNFLGFGVQPPTPEWGAILNENKSFITVMPYAAILPGMAILVTALALNLVGDALRDIYDVSLKDE